jgi:hypothetical protein
MFDEEPEVRTFLPSAEVKAEVLRQLAEFEALYRTPNPWMKEGQPVRHKLYERYGVIAAVGNLGCRIDKLVYRGERGLFDPPFALSVSLAEVAICWEPYDPSELGSRFDKACRDGLLVLAAGQVLERFAREVDHLGDGLDPGLVRRWLGLPRGKEPSEGKSPASEVIPSG